MKCETCKKQMSNPQFILRELTTLGYMDKEFCSKKCFASYVAKNGRKLGISIGGKYE